MRVDGGGDMSGNSHSDALLRHAAGHLDAECRFDTEASWGRLRQKRQARSSGTPSVAMRRPFAPWLGWATAGVLSVMLVAGLVRYDLGTTPEASEQWLAASETGSYTYAFDDGSRLNLASGAKGRLRANPSGSVGFELSTGRIDAYVSKRQGQRWSVHAGPFEVRVVGTEFSVNYDPQAQALHVSVQRGSVLVFGGKLAEPVRLAAGDRFQGDAESSRVTRQVTSGDALAGDTEPPTAEEPVATAAASSPAAPANPPATRTPAPSVSQLHAQGDYAAACQAAMRGGFQQRLQQASQAELWKVADACRLAGSATQASRALRTLRARFAGSDAAARAAFLLGRQADQAGRPEQATALLQTYLAEQPGGMYAAEALGRLMNLHHRAGRKTEAKQAARRYLQRAPNGPYSTLAQSLTP